MPEKSDDLLTQTEARAEAKRLNAERCAPEGLAYIAHTVPRSSWGGHEKGWTVSLESVSQFS